MGKEESIHLRDIGEDGLIDRLTAELPLGNRVICGPGDDCAVLHPASGTCYPETGKNHEEQEAEWLELLKTDVVVEGIHFSKEDHPEAVGWKAMARPLSDIAAMSGIPCAAVVTIIAPDSTRVTDVEDWYRGIRRAAESFEVSVVGGETSSIQSDVSVLSVALTGRVEKTRCLYRSGAQIGDAILVSGRLGGSLISGRHLNFLPRLKESRWLTEHFSLHAMMDLSDGLAKDLPRMMKASGTGYRLDTDSIPCHEGIDVEAALHDGEDFELLFTTDQENLPGLLEEWRKEFGGQLELTPIGEVSNTIETPLEGGWDHFAGTGK